MKRAEAGSAGLQTGTARRWRAKPAALLALIALAAACAPPPDPAWTLEGEAFGTRWTVRIRGPETDAAPVRAAIEAELDAVDRSMSNWRDDSELSRLNASNATDPQPVSEPLARVLEAALRVHEESGGAFDVTVGPLLRRFGFGPGGDPGGAAPDPAAVEAARARTGSHLLSLEPSHRGATLRRQVPGVELDLSGIAKGYAVDRVSTILTELGFAEHLVEVGGEIQARGEWTVGVQDPTGGIATRVHRSFPIRNLALATSGGYRDFRPADDAADRFWTHILDPRSGRPVERRTGSVTVLADSCLEADAWATALYVLGPDEGLEVAAELGVAALFLTANPDGTLEETATTAFTAAVRRRNEGSVTLRDGQGGASSLRGVQNSEPFPFRRERQMPIEAHEREPPPDLLCMQGGAELSCVGRAQRMAGEQRYGARSNCDDIADLIPVRRENIQAGQRGAPFLPRQEAMPHAAFDGADGFRVRPDPSDDVIVLVEPASRPHRLPLIQEDRNEGRSVPVPQNGASRRSSSSASRTLVPSFSGGVSRILRALPLPGRMAPAAMSRCRTSS